MSLPLRLSSVSVIAYMVCVVVAYGADPISCKFTRTLSLGKSNEEVKSLQRVLNLDKRTVVTSAGVGSLGNETDYFGRATQHSVALFQSIYLRSSHPGQDFTSGEVGPLTRLVLARVCEGYEQARPLVVGKKKANSSAAPVATSLEPKQTPVTKGIVPAPTFPSPLGVFSPFTQGAWASFIVAGNPGFGGGAPAKEIVVAIPALSVSFTNSVSVLRDASADVSSLAVSGGTTPYTYSWNFGDGFTSTSASPAHAYATSGAYTLSVSVTDALGQSQTKTASVVVSDPPLVTSFATTLSVAEGAAVDVSSLAVSGGTTPYTYSWNFGDGFTSTSASPAHAYSDNGSRTITLSVTDAHGNVRNHTATVTVTNVAPTPTILGTYNSTTGSSFSFSASVVDPGTLDTSTGFTYAWNFGDGTTSALASPTKVYYVPGSYTVTLTVSDKDGGSSATSVTATVTGDPLVIPGAGWGGATAQPSSQGNVGDFGYTDNTIARWDVVPHQTFSDTFRVGALAYHNSGIDHVAFAVNGGAWTNISTRSVNATSGVSEYWATVRAADFTDGQIEIRAVAYPHTGVPRVLPSLYLNANVNNTLPGTVKYVSNSGNDTTGTGTAGNPYLTISKAISVINTAQGGDVGGGTIYLSAGTYAYGAATENFSRNAATQWLTISAAPGVATNTVLITSYGSTNGVRTQKVHLKNVTISNIITLPTNSSISAKGWLDNSVFVGPGRTVANSQPFTSAAVWTGGMYFTDDDISACANGTVSAALARNVVVHDVGSDPFQSASLVVNSTARNVDATGTTFHPDIYQANGAVSNVILSGITATDMVGAQGLFSDSASAITDMAVENSTFNNQNPTPSVLAVMQLSAATNNLYILNSSFTGPALWRTDQNFVATDVVVENTTFSSSPGAVSGVTYR